MNIHKKQLEEVVITGPMHERRRASDYCYDRDYKVLYSGPARVNRSNKFDPTKFRMRAQREKPKQ